MFKMEIPCPHFIVCSGCTLNHRVENPPVLEEVVRFFKSKGIFEIPLHARVSTEWRVRAKLAVRGSPEAPFIGLYKAGSHEVVDIPGCLVHHPAINQAVKKIRAWILSEKIPPYNEIKKTGLLRYLQFAVERSTGKVQVTLVFNLRELKEDQKAMCLRLWENGGDSFWHSIWVNFNKRPDNVILSREWEYVIGEPLIHEVIAGTAVCFEPASFAQANIGLFEKIVERIGELVPRGAKVAEYYAGVGVIGMSLAEQSAWVRCCEINPQAENCFLEAKRQQLPETAKKIYWQQGAAESAALWLEEADVAVIDPPRKGVERPFLEILKGKTGISRLIYLSCGWEAFQRDAEELLAAGWCLAHADAYLLFPGSNHIELLVEFKR